MATTNTSIQSMWRIDPDGYIISPSGSKVARLVDGTLMLYDKKVRVALPFLLSDWAFLRQQANTISSDTHEVEGQGAP